MVPRTVVVTWAMLQVSSGNASHLPLGTVGTRDRRPQFHGEPGLGVGWGWEMVPASSLSEATQSHFRIIVLMALPHR